jgi:hypothetical protein
MRVLNFQLMRYGISIAILAALIWIALGPANLAGPAVVALAASDPVIAAAGDIACDPASESFNGGQGNALTCRQQYTSDLLLNEDLAAVLPLGDVQYHCGGYQAFLESYDLSWGRLKEISRPVVGNHEYLTSGDGTGCTDANAAAAGYFKYFGSAAGEPNKGYYSYNIGSWHLIALNSNCEDAGGCFLNSEQYRWLQADLAAHRSLCTLAYWHIPLFSSGGRTAPNTKSIWQLLDSHDVELVLSGHDHIYERFAPQTANGEPDPSGLRQFVVGTGGSNLTEIKFIAPNSEVRNNDTYGILKVTLHPTSYDWEFLPEAGKTFTDKGTDECHGTAPVSTLQVIPTPTSRTTPTPTVPPPPATTAFAFKPVADAYISKTLPAANFGASNMLRVFGGPLGPSYLRFDVNGLPGKVAGATLRLYAHSPSNAGYQVRAMANPDWGEATITFGNAPPIGDLIAESESFEAKQWTSVDLSSLVKENGTYNIVLFTFDGTPLSLASRNAIAPYTPQLVVDVLTDSIVIPISSPTPPVTPTLIATESPE